MKWTTVLAITLIVVFSGSVASAQQQKVGPRAKMKQSSEDAHRRESRDSGPSLQETTDWLKEKIHLGVGFGETFWAERLPEVCINPSMSARPDNFTPGPGNSIKVEGCSLVREQWQKGNGHGGIPRPWSCAYEISRSVSVDLSRLSRSGIMVKKVKSRGDTLNKEIDVNGDLWVVVLRGEGRRNLISAQWTDWMEKNSIPESHGGSGSFSEVYFEVEDSEMGERVSRALRHAAELCGAPEEPKEPF